MDFGLSPHLTDDPNTWIHQNQQQPFRQPDDDFNIIRGDSGYVIARGENQNVLQDPRVFGKSNILCCRSTFTHINLFGSKNFHSINLKIIFTDSDQDCLHYEALGEWSELVQDANGRALYRTWNFVDRVNGQETYIKYPSDWRGYFCRPIMYPKTPLGRFSSNPCRSTLIFPTLFRNF